MEELKNCANCGKWCSGRKSDLLHVPFPLLIYGLRLGYQPFCCGNCCHAYYATHRGQMIWRKLGGMSNLLFVGIVALFFGLAKLGVLDKWMYSGTKSEISSEREKNVIAAESAQKLRSTLVSAPELPTSMREWKDSSGRVMKASLEGFASPAHDTACFKREDGQKFDVPVSRFSTEDQAFINKLVPQ